MSKTTGSVGGPTSQPVAQLDADGLDRGIGFVGLLWTSETSIIGSGWLFGAFGAATIAGPSAILGWVLGTVIVLVMALVFAELSGMFPVSGGASRFPHYAFGSFAGASFGWASYLQAASTSPIEVLAAIQYLSSASWAHFARHWYAAHGSNQGTLSGAGIVAAVALMALFVVVNIVGIRFLAKVNGGVTSWKIFIPVLTVLILLIGHFHASNFGHAAGGFFVKPALKNILETLPAGVIFSLFGFEQAVQLGGEAKNPKDLPRAVILSIVIGATLYLLVQLAFLGAVPPSLLSATHGWVGLGTSKNTFAVALSGSPFYTLTKALGLAWLAWILSLDAIISPSGTGLIYNTASSRLSLALAKNGFVPTALARVNRNKIPVVGVVVAFVVGLLFLLPFPSWSQLVGVITSVSVLMYAAPPLALAALRKQKPDLPRPYRLPAVHILAPAAFVAATWVFWFSGWEVDSAVAIALIIGYVLIALNYTFKLNPNAPRMDWVAAPWIISYLVGILLLSYLGPFGPGGAIGGLTSILSSGGNGKLGGSNAVYWGLLVTAAFSLAIYYWAIYTRLPESKVDEYIAEVYPPPLAGG